MGYPPSDILIWSRSAKNGASFFHRALREFKGIAEVVREQKEAVSGELRIGIIPTLGPYLLPRFIPDMLASYARIRVTVREMPTVDMVAALRRDMLDVGIAATPLEKKGIREVPIFYEPFHGFVAAGHPLARREHLSAADLVADEMLLMNSGHCLHDQVSQLCMGIADSRTETSARLRLVSGSLEGLIRIVESGHGVTLLPELAAMTLPDSSRRLLRPIEPPVPARQLSLITHGEGIKTRLLEVLRQAILKKVPEGLKKKGKRWRVIDAKSIQPMPFSHRGPGG